MALLRQRRLEQCPYLVVPASLRLRLPRSGQLGPVPTGAGRPLPPLERPTTCPAAGYTSRTYGSTARLGHVLRLGHGVGPSYPSAASGGTVGKAWASRSRS